MIGSSELHLEMDPLDKIIARLKLEEFETQIKEANFTSYSDGDLVNLDLGLCEITSLPSDLFKLSPRVEMLNLSGNNITVIPPHLFEPLPRLRILGLKNNQIREITPDHFTYNHELELVNLQGNPIAKSLDTMLFDPKVKLVV